MASSIVQDFSAMEISSETISFDIESVNKLCGEATQVLVYGYECCKYDKVIDCFKRVLIGNDSIKIKRCFDVELGETLEGRNMCVIDGEKQWKDALVELVFENYLRIHEGKEIIPLIFCVDIDDNIYKYKIDSVTEKSHRFTDAELRRCYKLMYDLGKDGTAAALSKVATATFKFVKLVKNKDNANYSFETVATFSNEEWEKAMHSRRKGKPAKSTEWAKALMGLVQGFESSTKKTSKLIEDSLTKLSLKSGTSDSK